MENISAFRGVAPNPTFGVFEQLMCTSCWGLTAGIREAAALPVGWGERGLWWAPGWGSTFHRRVQTAQRALEKVGLLSSGKPALV